MHAALKLAERAYIMGEVPVGAVVVKDGRIIASAYNTRETEKNAVLHAETAAIFKACRALDTWRLTGCDLYVTLEPCAMCAAPALHKGHIL